MAPNNGKIVRIGGASAFWGDSRVGPLQLTETGGVDYLVFDYLAETTMAILAAARAKNPELGYATDFIDVTMKNILAEVVRRNIKIVANAGGVNPQGCADALLREARSLGLAPKVAVVLGDDVSPLLPALRQAGRVAPLEGTAWPERTLTANAYLGAFPIARALSEGADIVITGRCVDSATTLGVLIHEFGWSPGDHDLLAAGSLAGHIIECACQATGGLHTDWENVDDWANIGYPVIECAVDGQFVVTKPAGTGGLIAAAAVKEQLVYEIGDPATYILPDVVCDFRHVTIEDADGRVLVGGARGRPPTDTYKVSATYVDGFRCAGTMIIIGIDAAAKACRTGEAIIARTRAIFHRLGLPDYTATYIEVIGAETLYGPHARTAHAREVMMRVVVDHPSKEALQIFAREIAPAGTSWSPGTTMPGGGRPSPSPLVKQYSFLLPKSEATARVVMEDRAWTVDAATGGSAPDSVENDPAPEMTRQPHSGSTERVPLIKLAYARSGDKGNLSNIGVIARRPEYLPLILEQVTPQAVKSYFAHLVNGEVKRYLLPGINACNFVLFDALDGGGTASRRMDPLGKGMAQMLLDLPIEVPRELAARLK